MLSYLATTHRISRRGLADIASAMLNLNISLGAIDAILMRVSDAMNPIMTEVEQQLLLEERLNIDETGWKKKTERRWLWVFAGPCITVFKLDVSRGSQVLESMLGKEYKGSITSDDYSAYNKYVDKSRWQLCWAHMIRKFRKLAEGEGESKRFGEKLLKLSEYLFSYWHLYKARAISRNLMGYPGEGTSA